MKKRIKRSLLGFAVGLTSPLFANIESAEPVKRIEAVKKESKPLLKRVLEVHTDDLDAMIERRIIRVLVVHSKAFYGIENGKGAGVYHDAIAALEKQINQNHPHGNRHIKTKLIPVPVSREMLIPALNAGYGDIAMTGNTITKRREEQVAFSEPFASGINEILLTSEAFKGLTSFEDLSGKEVYIKPSMSYLDSLLQVSQTLVYKGLDPIIIKALPEELESEDILELLDEGLIGITIMDDYKAKMWSPLYKKVTLHTDIVFRQNSELALMVRKGNPKLLRELNLFIGKKSVKKDFSRVATEKYLHSKRYRKMQRSGISRKTFLRLEKTFEKYAQQYALDPLMLMAQAYQESRLKERARSHVGARGIMQLMPATAREMNVGSIHNTDANIHAGVKYHRMLKDHYFNDDNLSESDRSLFIFAGYNAGPNRINRFRRLARERGLDPDKWFGNVEVIAAEKIGRETVQYIQNIYNYYVAYAMMRVQNEAKLRAKVAVYESIRDKNGLSPSQKEQAVRHALARLTKE